MPNSLGHIEFRVSSDNLAFYRDLFAHLAWTTLADEASMLGVAGPGGGASLWFETNANDARDTALIRASATSADHTASGVNAMAANGG